MSAQRAKETPRRRAYHQAASVPVTMPPYTPNPEYGGRTIFAGVPSPLVAGRYHSLVADPDLPGELELSASFGDVVMGVRHRELPAEGVQFHPESVLTPQGKHLLRNFLGGE